MAWGATEGSHVFRAWVVDCMLKGSATGYTGLDGDTIKCALFGNTGTPDRNVAVASTGYNTGQWTNATHEKFDAAGWAAGGLTLAGQTVNDATANTFYFDATDRASTANVTLSAVHGCMNYDDTITAGTVADQGVCFNYFGGAQSVTAGSFTVVFAAPTAAIFSGTV